MTTTAFDDQFTVGTQPIEPVRQPYDIVSILHRNVADLELALKQQTERAEAAEAELLAVREDNHAMMTDINGLRTELAKLREQEPIGVAVACNKDSSPGFTVAVFSEADVPAGSSVYASPIPAPAAPAEFFTWVAAYGDYIEKLDVYNKKLTISKTLPFPGLDMNDEFQAFSAAQRKAHRMLPDLFEKARALLQSANHSEQALEKVAPDCRTCANRGQVNGLSQESYCDSCIYQGRDWRQNHFVDAVKRRCEACAILPCSCK